MNNQNNTMYIKGDLAEYTGKSEMVHGMVCHEYRWIEGRNIGKTAWTYRNPGEITANLKVA